MTTRRTRVLIVTGDPIGERMAGPAIRVWHMARVLSAVADVRVVSWVPIGRESSDFELVHVPERDNPAMTVHEAWCDVVIVQGMSFRLYPSIAATEKVVVADLYDPFQLEQLEMNRYLERSQWEDEVTKAVSLLNEQLSRADCFLCASEEQRGLWLGSLSSLGRLNPATYTSDPTFESFVRLAPFGLEEEKPQRRRRAIKGVVPGISETDTVLLWGGGIYNWFDPVTLVEAMGVLAPIRPDVKLFFLSAAHFNPDVPEMKALTDTVAAADRLGLTGRSVFFNESWVEYETRADYLLDADIGVSTHIWHAETRFSYRTRILDYLWAGLPIIASDGDVFARIIRERGLGIVVPPGDPHAVANAVLSLMSEPAVLGSTRARVETAREDFVWERTLAPLVEFCLNPVAAADAARARRRSGAAAATGFEGILALPRGPRRDLALLRHYLRQGGLRLVRDKLVKRRERLQRN